MLGLQLKAPGHYVCGIVKERKTKKVSKGGNRDPYFWRDDNTASTQKKTRVEGGRVVPGGGPYSAQEERRVRNSKRKRRRKTNGEKARKEGRGSMR